MRNKRVSGIFVKEKFINVIRDDEKYLVSLNIQDFSRLFGIEVFYVDPEKNRDSVSADFGIVNINVSSGSFMFDSEEKTLMIAGDIVILDGTKKFSNILVHPSADIMVSLTAYDKVKIKDILGN